MKNLLALFLVVLLSGCFLKQEPPKATDLTQATTPIAGIVTLQHIDGDAKDASFSAMFGLVNPQNAMRAMKASLEERASDKINCKVVKKDQSNELRASYISLGKIFFGPALQSSFYEIPQDSNGKYTKKFSGKIPPGIYSVKIEGGKYVKPFGEAFSIPEEIAEIDLKMPAGKKEIKKDTNYEVSWAEEAMPNDHSLDMVEVQSADEKAVGLVRCFGLEKNLLSSGKRIEFSIDKMYLAQLPSADKAILTVNRVHLHSSDRADIEFQGMRTQAFQVSVK